MALYASPKALGQVFGFNVLFADLTPEQYREVINYQLGIVKKSGSVSTWVLSNHDVGVVLPDCYEADGRSFVMPLVSDFPT